MFFPNFSRTNMEHTVRTSRTKFGNCIPIGSKNSFPNDIRETNRLNEMTESLVIFTHACFPATFVVVVVVCVNGCIQVMINTQLKAILSKSTKRLSVLFLF